MAPSPRPNDDGVPDLDPVAAARWRARVPRGSPWLHETIGARMAERLDWIKARPDAWMSWSPLLAGEQAHRAVAQRYPQARVWLAGELAQATLARLTGDEALAQRLRDEALEELGHAERLMARLIELGVAPSAGTLAPARLGRGVADFGALNRQLEQNAVVLYQDAADHARRVRDTGTEALLRELAAEEAQHLRQWLGSAP